MNAPLLEKNMPAFPERSASGSAEPPFALSQGAPEPLDSSAADPSHSDLLARYGITAVPLTCFEWGGYRYTNSRDAIAAARRGAAE